MFLKSDQDKANRELDCYALYLSQAIANLAKSEFEIAAGYHENIARKLRQLQVYKDNKQSTDMLARALKNAEREQHNERLLAVLKSGGVK